MEYGAVPNMSIFLHSHVLARKAVECAVVLNIRSGLQRNTAEIPSQAGERPDIALRSHDDVANKHSSRMNKRLRMNDWDDPLDGISGHPGSLRPPIHARAKHYS